jgi:hypothetical protein
MTDNEKINEQLMRSLPICLLKIEDTTQLKRIEIDNDALTGESVKTHNVKLHLPLFVKVVCETVIDGIHAFHMPYLVFPAFLKLIISVKELLTIELTKIQTSILIAIHNLNINGDPSGIEISLLKKEAFDILKNSPFDIHPSEKEFEDSINYLIKANCISINEENKVQLIEVMTLTV